MLQHTKTDPSVHPIAYALVQFSLEPSFKSLCGCPRDGRSSAPTCVPLRWYGAPRSPMGCGWRLLLDCIRCAEAPHPWGLQFCEGGCSCATQVCRPHQHPTLSSLQCCECRHTCVDVGNACNVFVVGGSGGLAKSWAESAVYRRSSSRPHVVRRPDAALAALLLMVLQHTLRHTTSAHRQFCTTLTVCRRRHCRRPAQTTHPKYNVYQHRNLARRSRGK